MRRSSAAGANGETQSGCTSTNTDLRRRFTERIRRWERRTSTRTPVNPARGPRRIVNESEAPGSVYGHASNGTSTLTVCCKASISDLSAAKGLVPARTTSMTPLVIKTGTIDERVVEQKIYPGKSGISTILVRSAHCLFDL